MQDRTVGHPGEHFTSHADPGQHRLRRQVSFASLLVCCLDRGRIDEPRQRCPSRRVAVGGRLPGYLARIPDAVILGLNRFGTDVEGLNDRYQEWREAQAA